MTQGVQNTGDHSGDLAFELTPNNTRRTLLGMAGGFVLAASGLVLPIRPEAEAAHPVNRVRHRVAKRRQQRRHRLEHRRDQQQHDPGEEPGPSDILRKGISMYLSNNIQQTTRAELGIINKHNHQCLSPAIFPMPPLTGFALYNTSDPEGYSWVEDRYFFGFENPIIGTPFVWVGDGGSAKVPCHARGVLLLKDRQLREEQSVTLFNANRKFIITRQKDNDFKVFTVDIFATF